MTEVCLRSKGLGINSFLMYLDGECSFDEAIELIKRDTRRFAKRQISWFKRDKRIHSFFADKETADGLVQSLYEYFMNPELFQEDTPKQNRKENKPELCTEKHTATY